MTLTQFGRLAITREDPMAARWRELGLWRGETLPALLDRTAEHKPDAVAITDGRVQLTYGQLHEASRRVASALRRRGLQPGESVLIQVPCWWESVVMTYAVQRVGAVAAHVVTRAGNRHTRHALEQLNVRCFVISTPAAELDPSVRAALASQALIVSVRVDDELDSTPMSALLAEADDGVPDHGDANAPAIVLFTSGTTSVPKGVIHTHNTLRAEADGLAGVHGCSPADVFLVAMQIGHIGGVIYSILAPLVCGGRAVFMSEWHPDRALKLIADEGVTIFPGVPAFLTSLRGVPGFGPGSVRSVRLFAVGGSRVTAASVREAAEVFACWAKRGYGSTEMPTATNSTVDDGPRIWWETDGRPIGYVQVRIRSTAGHLVGADVEGEIELCGPELFQGYADAARNDAVFTDDGWYRTGDRGSLDGEGALTITGRTSDMIIRGGENISAQEIEELALELRGVDDVAVVAMPDERLGERVCAFVIASEPLTLEALVAHLRVSGLATFKLPERLEIRAEFPRTSAGKILKRDLRAEVTRLVTGTPPTDGTSQTKPAN